MSSEQSILKSILYTLIAYFITLLNIGDNLLNYIYGSYHGFIPQSVPCGKATKDSGEPRKNGFMKSGEKFSESIVPGVTSIPELWDISAKKFANNKCMGYREVIKVYKKKVTVNGVHKVWDIPELTPMKYLTYSQVDERIRAFSNGLMHFANLKEKDKIAIFMDTRMEWMIALQAALRNHLVVATVYANLGEDALIQSLQETESTTIITAGKDVKKLNTKELPDLKYVIYVDDIPAEDEETKWNFKIQSFQKTEILGTSLEPYKCKNPPTGEDLALIMFTSGTSGKPKGVMIKHKNIACAAKGLSDAAGGVYPSDVYLAYLPLAHIMELTVECLLLFTGSCIGYGTPRTLADTGAKPHGDLMEVRPTVMATVPRVLETIKQGALEQINAQDSVVKWLFQMAFEMKYRAITSGRETPLWDALIFNRFKQRLGGRSRVWICGGAPLAEETQKFIRICFGIQILQGYGLTETCASCTLQYPFVPFTTGNVGCPVKCGEIKLRDVPEMGYSHLDKPYPRGEIAMRGNHVCAGYYKRPELNKECFDSEGWFYSGDIGQWLPDGTLQIIDRKKNLIKMARGEYIAPENLESIYCTSPFVSNIMVYGDSFKDDLVALVIPNEKYLTKWAKNNDISGDFKTLCDDPDVRKVVLDSLREIAIKNNRKKFEYIVDLRLCSDEWTDRKSVV